MSIIAQETAHIIGAVHIGNTRTAHSIDSSSMNINPGGRKLFELRKQMRSATAVLVV